MNRTIGPPPASSSIRGGLGQNGPSLLDLLMALSEGAKSVKQPPGIRASGGQRRALEFRRKKTPVNQGLLDLLKVSLTNGYTQLRG